MNNITDTVVTDVKANKRKCQELEADLKRHKQRADMSANMIQAMSKQIATLKNQTMMNAAKHMTNELILGGVRREEAEDPFEAARRFLQNRLTIDIPQDDILDAYRSKYSSERTIKGKNVQIPPVMFITTTEAISRKILRNKWRLTGQKQEPEGYGLYVRQCLPEGLREVRKRYSSYTTKIRETNDKKKEDEEKIQYWFSGDKFYVDGNLVAEDFAAPSPTDMLFLTEEEEQRMDAIHFAKSDMVTDQGSEFKAFGVETNDLATIRLAYKKVKQLEPKADHIMLGYRLVDEEGKTKHGGVHDGEYFGDLEILDILKNKEKAIMAVFVSRVYGGIHLGRKRFQLIKEVATEVIEMMKGIYLAREEKEVEVSFRETPREGRGGFNNQNRSGRRWEDRSITDERDRGRGFSGRPLDSGGGGSRGGRGYDYNNNRYSNKGNYGGYGGGVRGGGYNSGYNNNKNGSRGGRGYSYDQSGRGGYRYNRSNEDYRGRGRGGGDY